MRIALFGSPTFAIPVLDALLQAGDVVAVVTQPAKPVGRGLRLVQPPLAQRALELGLRLEQPARLRGNTDFHELLAGLKLDVAVTAAYGNILPASLLEVPREGFLNVHGSLLPRWRGAAPVQWALISGDTETGISIMQTETGLDTGPVRLARRLQIGPDETAPELFARLSELGASAVAEALGLLAAGRLPSVPQDDALATHAPMLTRADGLLDFRSPAGSNYNRYRGVAAWPGTWFPHNDLDVKVHSMRPAPDAAGLPGQVLRLDSEGMLVACGSGALLLEELQSPGRKRLRASDWAAGMQIRQGTQLKTLED